MGRRWAGLTALAVVAAALASAGGVGAAGGQDRVSGAAVQTLFPGTSSEEHDQYAVGATSDPDGSNPSGSIEYSSDAAGLPQQHFHGDVSQGCVIVHGNMATVVGMLPPSEQFYVQTGGGPRLIEWVAVFVQDNGHPVQGQPTDQAVAVLEFDTSGPKVCATGTPPPFGLQPIDHGNFDVYDAS